MNCHSSVEVTSHFIPFSRAEPFATRFAYNNAFVVADFTKRSKHMLPFGVVDSCKFCVLFSLYRAQCTGESVRYYLPNGMIWPPGCQLSWRCSPGICAFKAYFFVVHFAPVHAVWFAVFHCVRAMSSHQFTRIISWFRIGEVKATAGQWFVFTTQSLFPYSFCFVRYHSRIIYIPSTCIFGVVWKCRHKQSLAVHLMSLM